MTNKKTEKKPVELCRLTLFNTRCSHPATKDGFCDKHHPDMARRQAAAKLGADLTTEKVRKMNNGNLKRKIAKALAKDDKFPITIPTPNYPDDLNAMQDAVNEMVKRHGTAFIVGFDHNLEKIIGHHDHLEHDMIHASARWRAEAFVMTLRSFERARQAAEASILANLNFSKKETI